MSLPQALILPDLKKMCPWNPHMNPHLKSAGVESAAWVDSFNIFHGKKLARFHAAGSELCSARTYPYAGFEEYRIACDFVNLLFVLDETCDDQDSIEATQTCDIALRAMKGDLLEGSAFIRLIRDWKDRFDRKKLPKSQSRFLKIFEDYLDGVMRETELRDAGRTVDIEQCTLLRRKYSGTQTVFALFEYIHGIDLPDVVFENQTFIDMYWAAIDMVNFSNDLYSYRMEVERGLEGNSLLTVLTHTEGLGLQDAVDHLGEHFRGLVESFVCNKTQLPSFSTAHGGYAGVDDDVEKYVYSMEQWVIGSLAWSFESPRYFGADRGEVTRTLVVPIRKSIIEDIDDSV